MGATMQLFVLCLVQVMSMITSCYGGLSNVSFPAIIILGDSTVDTGNNNHMATLFRCDHPPYGRDYLEKLATGRWSDGFMALDFVAQKLGLTPPLPYLDPKAEGGSIVTGINFASGGAGLLDGTGEAASIASMTKQMKWYFDYQHKLRAVLEDDDRFSYIISNALHVISVGTNDYIVNFYLPPDVPHNGNLTQFRTDMLNNYEQHIEALYEGGARVIAIVGLPPMGCLPYTMAFYNTTDPSGCVEYMNVEVESFNIQLKALLSEMRQKLNGVKIIYVDLFDVLYGIVKNFQTYGFKYATRGCCGNGILAFGPTCTDVTVGTCKDTSDYVFFDAIHPTEYTYQFIAKAILSTLDANL